MLSPYTRYAAPPRARNPAGKLRRVGLEVEFGHLTVEKTLDIVASVLGGTVTLESPAEGSVEGTAFGKFKVELDSMPLKERRYLDPLEKMGVESDSNAARLVEESVLRIARELVPVEVVTPPVAWDRLGELDPVWDALRAHGAEDTRTSLLYAFGLHLNPELPDLEASTTVRYLRTYFLLEDWIVKAANVDITRRIAPYIHPFPEEYRRLVIDPEYDPRWSAFADDYVSANPTRNRPLDVLPLIAETCGEDFGDRVDNWDKVKARPAFHYRLPNCELSESGWTPAVDWNRWVLLERVAEEGALVEELALAYLKTPDLPLRIQRSDWIQHVDRQLSDLSEETAATSWA